MKLHKESVHQKEYEKFKCSQCPYESCIKSYTTKHEKRVYRAHSFDHPCKIAVVLARKYASSIQFNVGIWSPIPKKKIITKIITKLITKIVTKIITRLIKDTMTITNFKY